MSENHDGGAVCRHSSAQNEPDCHFMANFYFVSQGTGVERGGEQDNTEQGRSHAGSHSPWGKREEQARGSGLEAAKIQVICCVHSNERGQG